MTEEKVRRIDVFFYGLFMDEALLREKGIDPAGRRIASLKNFRLVIGARATLVPCAGQSVHGVLFSLTHAEVDALYSEDSVSVYRPEAVSAQLADGIITPYHLLILMFGEAYTSDIPTPVILDNLLSARKIPPVVAVFVGNVAAGPSDARKELSCYEPFSRFLATELLAWIRAHYRVSERPSTTVIGGASRGGLAAVCAALEHPEQFGNVSAQTGFFVYKDRNWFKHVDPAAAPDAASQDELAWEQYGVVMQRIAAMPKLPLRFYLDVGKFENDFHPSPLTANRHLRDVLTAKGYALKYQEFAGHHSTVNLRGTFSDALMFLLSDQPPQK